MAKDMEHFISRCVVCQQYSKSSKEQRLKLHKIDLPWSKIGIDFAKVKNKDCLQ